jgi:hypothetical protein
MRVSVNWRPAAFAVVVVAILGGCGSSGSRPPASASAHSQAASGGKTSTSPTTGQPAATTAGSETAQPTVIQGLVVAVPVGWTIMEDNPVNFDMNPPGRPNEIAFIWLNMSAVKSTGHGHGTTVLANVGTTPSALVRWLTTNPDLRVSAAPTQVSIDHVPMTTLVVGVSATARYGDPHCPANPHCADLFTKYGGGEPYGIGGKEVVRLYLGHISSGTAIVGLDGNDPAALRHLEKAAKPFLNGIRFPG